MRTRPVRRTFLLSVLAAALLFPLSAQAQQIRVSGSDTESRVVSRMPVNQALFGITSEDGQAALLLTERGIVLQLTDQGLARVTSMEESKQEDQGMLTRLFEGLVRSGVRALLDHGIEYPLADLAAVRYEQGRLHFVRNNGEPIFEDVRVNDVSVMESFRAQDARAFVTRFHAEKARGTI
jgi:hypothetical protein